MNCNFVIKEPIWHGGSRYKYKGPKVGLNEAELSGDMVRLKITYKKKNGELEYPYTYEMPVSQALTYQRENVKKTGVWLRIIPISHFAVIV